LSLFGLLDKSELYDDLSLTRVDQTHNDSIDDPNKTRLTEKSTEISIID
jgi:hypothetical protein